MEDFANRKSGNSDGVAKAKMFAALREKLLQSSDVFTKWMAMWHNACGAVLLVGGQDLLDLMLKDLAEKRLEILKLEQKVLSVRNNLRDVPSNQGQVGRVSAPSMPIHRPAAREAGKRPSLARQKVVQSNSKTDSMGSKTDSTDSTGQKTPMKNPAQQLDSSEAVDHNKNSPITNEIVRTMVSAALSKVSENGQTTKSLYQIGPNKLLVIQSPFGRAETFEGVGFSPMIMQGIKAYGFTEPLPFQRAMLNGCLADSDIICQAPCQAGKTSAVALSILQNLTAKDPFCHVLVIAPTKESAKHFQTDVLALGTPMQVQCHACTNGTSADVDVMKLKAKPCHVIVGTPGRIYDLILRQAFDIEIVKTVILEDGDTLFTPGFREQIQNICSKLPSSRKTILICNNNIDHNLMSETNVFSGIPSKVTGTTSSFALDGVVNFYVRLDQNNNADRKDILTKICKQFGPENIVTLASTELKPLTFESFQEADYWEETLGSGERVYGMTLEEKEKIFTQFESKIISDQANHAAPNILVNLDFPKTAEQYLERTSFIRSAQLVICLVESDIDKDHLSQIEEALDVIALELELAKVCS